MPIFQASTEQYYELILAHNNIKHINSSAFSGLRIQKLDLSENSITSISDNAFLGLETKLLDLEIDAQGSISLPTKALEKLAKLKRLYLKGFQVNSISNNAFSAFVDLESLHLVSCKIQSIGVDAFKGLETKLTELSLKSNALTTVPSGQISALVKLRKLTLTQNKITAITNNAFQTLTDLEELDFSHNEITTINIDAFKGLETKLSFLTLHLNQLAESQLSSIKQLQGLTQLNLAYNRLASIPDYTFRNMQRLTFLNMQDNQISSLTPNSLVGLENSLIHLSLAENKLTQIPDDIFLKFTQLGDLFLDRQDLSGGLRAHSFRGLQDSLLTLSLEKTQFSIANLVSLANLHNLKTLYLCENRLVLLRDFSFENLKKLSRLEICDNGLTTISPKAFYGLQESLEHVMLQKNSLSTLDHCTFNQFSKLKEINLVENSLNCDCHLRWLRKWLDAKYDSSSIQMVTWRCAVPTKHINKLFRTIPETELTCDVDVPMSTCDAYSPSTSPPGGATTTISSLPVMAQVTSTTADTITLTWTVSNTQDLTGFLVTYKLKDHSIRQESPALVASARSYELKNLQPRANYTVCVVRLKTQGRQGNQYCLIATTKPKSTQPAASTASVPIIVGSVIGVIVFLLLLALLIVMVVKYRRENKEVPDLEKPRVVRGSKRYSKPKPVSGISQLDPSHLHGEVNHGTSISNISTDSSTRYFISPTPTLPRAMPQAPFKPAPSTPNPIAVEEEYIQPTPTVARPAPDGGYLAPRAVIDELNPDALDDPIYEEITANHI